MVVQPAHGMQRRLSNSHCPLAGKQPRLPAAKPQPQRTPSSSQQAVLRHQHATTVLSTPSSSKAHTSARLTIFSPAMVASGNQKPTSQPVLGRRGRHLFKAHMPGAGHSPQPMPQMKKGPLHCSPQSPKARAAALHQIQCTPASKTGAKGSKCRTQTRCRKASCDTALLQQYLGTNTDTHITTSKHTQTKANYASAEAGQARLSL